MRILFICLPYGIRKGGMEKTAKNLMEIFSSENHEISLIYMNTPDFNGYPLTFNVNVYTIEKSERNNVFILEDLFFKINPDIAIVFSADHMTSASCLVLDRLNIPFIIHEASNPERVINEKWKNVYSEFLSSQEWERNIIYSAATRIRFTLDIYQASLPMSLRMHSVAFANFFPLFDNIERNDYIARKRIINIGGLKRNKNLLPLINAFDIIYSDFPEWELVIFASSTEHLNGSNRFAAELINYAKTLKSSKNIKFYPPVGDIDLEYNVSAIHVIPSLSEGLPNSLAEAMTHALPSIGISSCPGVNCLIKNYENGLLVENDEYIHVNIAAALRELILNDEMRFQMGQKAYFDSLQIFPKEKNLEQWLKLIDTVKEYKGTNRREEERCLNNRKLTLHFNRMRNLFYQHFKSLSFSTSNLSPNELSKLKFIEEFFQDDTKLESLYNVLEKHFKLEK